MDKAQKMRYSKAELELLRNTFGENEELLYSLRNFFLQLPHAEIAKPSEDLIKILKKSLLPELDPDIPLLQQADIYFGLSSLKEMNPAIACLHIRAKDIVKEFTKQCFDVLETGHTTSEIVLKELREEESKTDEKRYVDMIAYLEIVNRVDIRFNELANLSKGKEETPEEKKEREAKNSNK